MSFLSSKEKKENNKEEENKENWLEPEGRLIIDLYETDKDLVIEAPVAGVNPDDIEISLEKDLLIIKGKREKKNEKEKRKYLIQECYWGPFSREIILPVEVDSMNIRAEIENSFLIVRIPKAYREEKRKIEVKRNSKSTKGTKKSKKKEE